MVTPFIAVCMDSREIIYALGDIGYSRSNGRWSLVTKIVSAETFDVRFPTGKEWQR
jgi:hypothetical protein